MKIIVQFNTITSLSPSLSGTLNAIQFTEELESIDALPNVDCPPVPSPFSGENQGLISNSSLTPFQNFQMQSLLKKYQHIFQARPRRHKF